MEEYRIVLESQLGPREGILRLDGGEEGAVSGSITLLGMTNAASGHWVREGIVQLFHHLHTRISDLECISVLKIEGDRLSGTLQNEGNTMLWHGERVKAGKKGGQIHAGK